LDALFFIISGMRNSPPISMSSPRDTIASFPFGQSIEHKQNSRGIVVDD
jgi:hypothetical protein